MLIIESRSKFNVFFAENKFMNKPELISQYFTEVNFHEILDSW